MKKSVKLRDFLNLAGIADEDNETQYKNFEKTVTKALKNVFGKDPAKDAAKNVAKDASAAVLNAEDPKTKLKNELDDLKKDYENNKEHTFGGVTIKDYEPKKFDGKTDEENRAEAEMLLEKLNDGEDFDELIKKHGEDLYLFNNDDGYYISRGSYQKEFEDAAFELEIGEISGIVKTGAGYSIIKRYPKDAVYMAENFDTLADDYIRGQYNMILEKKEAVLSAADTKKMADYPVFSLTMGQ